MRPLVLLLLTTGLNIRLMLIIQRGLNKVRGVARPRESDFLRKLTPSDYHVVMFMVLSNECMFVLTTSLSTERFTLLFRYPKALARNGI